MGLYYSNLLFSQWLAQCNWYRKPFLRIIRNFLLGMAKLRILLMPCRERHSSWLKTLDFWF